MYLKLENPIYYYYSNNNYHMNIAHYKRFCQQLDLDKFNGNVDEACLFYFKLLQELGL